MIFVNGNSRVVDCHVEADSIQDEGANLAFAVLAFLTSSLRLIRTLHLRTLHSLLSGSTVYALILKTSLSITYFYLITCRRSESVSVFL